MDVILIFNGLGNQMSQQALIEEKIARGQRVCSYYAFGGHNKYELKRLFGINPILPWYFNFIPWIFRAGMSRRFYSKKTADRLLAWFRIKIVIEKPDYGFDPEILQPWAGLRFLVGGWHNARYFESARLSIRNIFHFPMLDELNQHRSEEISQVHSISIHVRRGDYMNADNAKLFGGISTIEYYRTAIEKVISDADLANVEPKFYVFSDDLKWCKKNLGLSDAIFVEGNNGKDSWKDLVLISRCQINILANSTFSWWAAWLNERHGHIAIRPRKFANTEIPGQTIYPENWLEIDSSADAMAPAADATLSFDRN